jgi:hypothetical protein
MAGILLLHSRLMLRFSFPFSFALLTLANLPLHAATGTEPAYQFLATY